MYEYELSATVRTNDRDSLVRALREIADSVERGKVASEVSNPERYTRFVTRCMRRSDLALAEEEYENQHIYPDVF